MGGRGGGLGGSSGGQGARGGDGDPPHWLLLPAAGGCYVTALFVASNACDLWSRWSLPRLDTTRSRVSVVVPALNEERGIRDTLQKLKQVRERCEKGVGSECDCGGQPAAPLNC